MSADGSEGPPADSPCNRVCRLDVEGRYCVGCRRTMDEITAWWSLDDSARRAVLRDLERRTPAVDSR